MLFDTAAKLSQYFSFPVFEASSAKRQSLPETSHNNMTEHRHTSRARSRTRSRYLLDTAECDTQWTTAGWPRYSLDDHPLLPTNLAKRGYHKFTCLHVPFHVKKQYNFIRELGVGAYGCVALAYDAERNMNVAIKKLANVFSRETITRRALREVSALEHLRGGPNIVELLEFDATFIEFSELYLVLPANDADLQQIISSHQHLTETHVKYFTVQLLRAMQYMHDAHFVHRDLKPGNLLVNADCKLHVCDFGMTRAFACEDDDNESLYSLQFKESMSLSMQGDAEFGDDPFALTVSESSELAEGEPKSPKAEEHLFTTFFAPTSQFQDIKNAGKTDLLKYPGGPLTEYVSTRWYRAPEVLLCFQGGYGPSIDMWAVGCVLAEMLTGRPLFPGRDYLDQLYRISAVLGSPPESVLNKTGSKRAREHVISIPKSTGVPLSSLFSDISADALDLLSKLLLWDPSQRLTASEALAHPWFKRYHQASFSGKMPPPFDRFVDVEMTGTPGEFKQAFERESLLVAVSNASAFESANANREKSLEVVINTNPSVSNTWRCPSSQCENSSTHSVREPGFGLTHDGASPSSLSSDSDEEALSNFTNTDTMSAFHHSSKDLATSKDKLEHNKTLFKRLSGFSIFDQARTFINWS